MLNYWVNGGYGIINSSCTWVLCWGDSWLPVTFCFASAQRESLEGTLPGPATLCTGRHSSPPLGGTPPSPPLTLACFVFAIHLAIHLSHLGCATRSPWPVPFSWSPLHTCSLSGDLPEELLCSPCSGTHCLLPAYFPGLLCLGWESCPPLT